MEKTEEIEEKKQASTTNQEQTSNNSTTIAIGKLLSTRSVLVTNESHIVYLWNLGNYGCSSRATRFQPKFIEQAENAKKKQQKKNKNNFEEISPPETLQLNLMEAFYLVNKNHLIIPPFNNNNSALHEEFKKRYDSDTIGFDNRYKAYETFRNSEWVTKTGTQYGTDYVLYAGNINKCHSSFCVHLNLPKNNVELLRSLRVAEQTKKRIVLWEIDSGGLQIKRFSLKPNLLEIEKQKEQQQKKKSF